MVAEFISVGIIFRRNDVPMVPPIREEGISHHGKLPMTSAGFPAEISQCLQMSQSTTDSSGCQSALPCYIFLARITRPSLRPDRLPILHLPVRITAQGGPYSKVCRCQLRCVDVRHDCVSCHPVHLLTASTRARYCRFCLCTPCPLCTGHIVFLP